MRRRTRACSIGVKVRSGTVVGRVPPSMWLTQPSAADVGNWMTAFGTVPSMLQSTIAVVAGSDEANSS
jgi:hypothetical protein